MLSKDDSKMCPIFVAVQTPFIIIIKLSNSHFWIPFILSYHTVLHRLLCIWHLTAQFSWVQDGTAVVVCVVLYLYSFTAYHTCSYSTAFIFVFIYCHRVVSRQFKAVIADVCYFGTFPNFIFRSNITARQEGRKVALNHGLHPLSNPVLHSHRQWPFFARHPLN